MHAVMSFLAKDNTNKEIFKMQRCNKRMYTDIVPKWKPTLKVRQKNLLIRLMQVLAKKHTNRKIEVVDKDMEWVTASLVRKMVQEDYYDEVYPGIN